MERQSEAYIHSCRQRLMSRVQIPSPAPILLTISENLNSKSMHHFVIKDGLEVEFNLYDDSQKMSEAMKSIS